MCNSQPSAATKCRANDEIQIVVVVQIYERRRGVPADCDTFERVFIIDSELELRTQPAVQS